MFKTMENIKISFLGNPEFKHSISNKTGKHVTTCTLSAEIHTAFRAIPSQFLIVTTKAICSENDSYDPKIGEKIALAKAEIKLYEKGQKIIGIILENCQNNLKIFENMVKMFDEKTERTINHNVEYIERIS